MGRRGLPCRHTIKAHFGPVVCGPVGPRGDRRFDVYGETVNVAALLNSQGLAITEPAFRKLKARTRRLFRKRAVAATYVAAQGLRCVVVLDAHVTPELALAADLSCDFEDLGRTTEAEVEKEKVRISLRVLGLPLPRPWERDYPGILDPVRIVTVAA